MIARERRVVLTGLGMVSPIGNTRESFWQSLSSGKSGVSWLGNTDVAAGAIHDFEGSVKDFGDLPPETRKTLGKAHKLMNRQAQMGVAAALQALNDSRFQAGSFEPERVGICFGADNVSLIPEDFLSAIRRCHDDQHTFCFERWGREGLEEIDPLWLLRYLPNMPACHIAITKDFRGPCVTITQRGNSANLVLAEACTLIRNDEADLVVAGATGTTLEPINRIHAVAQMEIASGLDAAGLCRPFDRDRTGAVLGEGAAVFILEDLASALRRGVPAYGEVLAWGSSCVVEREGTPRGDLALANALRGALQRARIDPLKLGHIHANGLGGRRADAEEARGLHLVLGADAEKIPLVAAKSQLGNAGAGSGALELAASLLALQHGKLFPVLNYEHPDPQCRVAAVHSTDVEAGTNFVNVNMVSQGQASCLIVARAA